MNVYRGLAVLMLTGGPLHAQTDAYPFVGTWDCEVATFTFTDSTYNNGSENRPIQSITQEGDNYILDFADGYQIGLSSVSDTSMEWLSGASGDMFTCTRMD